MRAIAHSKRFAGKAGVSQTVGKEFEAADEAQSKATRDKKPDRSNKKMRKSRYGSE